MALAIDQVPTLTQTILSQSISTGQFTTTAASEIIIVMCTSDGLVSSAQTFTITDSNNNAYTLIKRSNSVTNDGTCEAWYTLVSSTQTNLVVTATCSSGATDRLCLQVVTLSGHDIVKPIGATGSFAISGAAVTGNITTTINNSWVFAAFSNASGSPDNTSSVVGSNQTKISQGTTGLVHGEGTFWRQTSTTTNDGTTVTSNLTTPATDTGDMIAFEIVPPIDADIVVLASFTNPATNIVSNSKVVSY